MNLAHLPADFIDMAMIILLMGMRHGFDADHLAAIDGLTRYNAAARPRLARAAGVLFAMGHGLVVVSVAVGVSALARTWRVPAWLDSFGAWVSIVVLTLLAVANITAAVRSSPLDPTPLKGLRSQTFAGLLRADNPVFVMGVGTLFALSFDTLTQATLFAATATRLGGWPPVLALAMCFMVGMLLIDGVNGAWVARLLRRSDRSARVASRVMALAVAGVGLLTAALALATRTLPWFDAWTQGKELWFGVTVVAIVATSFALGRQLAHRWSMHPQPEGLGIAMPLSLNPIDRDRTVPRTSP
jgi:high-affinity nickel-transport protein